MKKLISIFLTALLVLSAVSLIGCGGKDPETAKFGVGIVKDELSGISATEAKNGSGTATYTVAVVLVDKDGKIVKCELDTLDFTLEFTAAGKYVPAGSLVSKAEAGADYGMAGHPYAPDVNGDGVVKEWFEQADIFCSKIVGKTVTEVKALVAEEGRGNADLQTAGCTIAITGFVSAVEAAVANAKTDVSKDASLSIGVVASAEGADATATTEGSQTLTMDIVGMALTEGKVAASYTTSLEAVFKFTAAGAITTSTATDKRALGDDYGMANNPYSADLDGDGVILEWYKQVEALDSLYVGKTASEIGALVLNTSYGNEDVVNADCTISIAGYVAAAVKAASN